MYLYVNQKVEQQGIYHARKYSTGKYRKFRKNQKNTQNDKNEAMAPL